MKTTLRHHIGRLSYRIKRAALRFIGIVLNSLTSALLKPTCHIKAGAQTSCLFHTLKLGDSVVLTPTIGDLLKDPQNHLYILCGKEGAQIFQGLVPGERIIIYDIRSGKDFIALIKRLRILNIGLFIDAHNSFMDLKRFFLPLLVSHSTTQRIGFSTPYFMPWLPTALIPWISEAQHEVEAYRKISAALGLSDMSALCYAPHNADVAAALRDKLTHRGWQPATEKLVVIHAPALGRRKRWKAEYFAQLAENIAASHKHCVVFTGIRSEEALLKPIFQHITSPCIINMCGELSFAEFVEIIRTAALLISVDTSAIHIATATQTPTIALFGPSNENVWAPYEKSYQTVVHSNIACRPCDRLFSNNEACRHVSCMADIRPEQVYKIAEKYLHCRDTKTTI